MCEDEIDRYDVLDTSNLSPKRAMILVGNSIVPRRTLDHQLDSENDE